jgi:CHAD domain-containing protein
MTLLQERSKSLARGLSKSVSKVAESVSEKGVHRLRTTIRRVETLVNYTEPSLNKKQEKVLDDLRALRKRAGKVRDLDIQIGLLASIGNRSASADKRALAETLKKKRTRQAGRLASEVKKLEGPKFSNRLARISEKSGVETDRPEEAGGPLEEIKKDLATLSAEFSSQEILKPRRLHELRIKLKLLRYRAELARETAEQKELAAKLKSVQDAIGEWHDWEMLAESAEKQFGDRMNCALLVEIRSLFSAKYAAANSAAMNLLTSYSPVPRKKPHSVQTARAVAQRA